MKKNRFNLLFYFIILSSLALIGFGIFLSVYDKNIHNRFLLKDAEAMNIDMANTIITHYNINLSQSGWGQKKLRPEINQSVWGKAVRESMMNGIVKIEIADSLGTIIYSTGGKKIQEKLLFDPSIFRTKKPVSRIRKDEADSKEIIKDTIETTVPVDEGLSGTYLIVINISEDYIKQPVQDMERTLSSVILSGLLILLVSLFVIVARAQSIINKESRSLKRESYLQTVKALVNAIEARDPYTKGHSLHVADIMKLIYDRLPESTKKTIDPQLLEFSGLLHDIGKIGIPEAVLDKNGPLNSEEWKLMKTHPEIGAQILKPVEDLGNVVNWIYHHHEKPDGTGYPDGLKAPDIPFISKIISIADTFSALATDRPYRKGMNYQEAVSIMKKSDGMQLDSDLLKIFLEIEEKALL